MLSEFERATEAVGSTVKRFTTIAEAVPYVRTLAGAGIVVASRLPTEIEEVFSNIPFAPVKDASDAHLCISFARAGIAATGTLFLDLADPHDRAFTALPVVHAVFLKASTIVADIYALHNMLAQALTSETAYFSLTTGPSRTADIERVLTIGVHGPKELHILILEGD